MKKIIISVSIAIILLIGIGYFLNELSQSRSFQFFGGLITSVETNEKVVALTFDDGPGVNTGEVLDILREHNVKGTFYLTGYEIENYFTKAETIVRDGHEIGNHSYSHQRMVFKSPSFIQDEIAKTDEWIRLTGYEGEITFRPPFGRRLVLLPYYLSKDERKTVLWNIEPETYPDIASDANKIVEHVVENIEPGSIILLHVMYESRRESLQSIEGIITSLKEQGYTFLTVSELLEYDQQ
ncbi:polysaccharide deacetylase family protein [Alkalihalobacterium chitinilyticum]|uniref:Polysaccharide deacetylase family protein n=1 Tax=Alkalihalobacterium chitinilyticum TaxID=2980103 RepID=A0ABT5VNG0_9BACI|nr:polysaccharide deacetylase family protein [Alkalihalobacterium chitinilyticum]MDE5416023.1 polysaccharide deacetylase family protein [Alkalihalobacterium chitinilyticum]